MTSSLTVGISPNVMNGLYRDMEKMGALIGISMLISKRKRKRKRKKRKRKRRKKKNNRVGYLTYNSDRNSKTLCPWIYGFFFGSAQSGVGTKCFSKAYVCVF